MNALLTAKEAILAACKPIDADAAIIVPTALTYPDGDPVRIYIEPHMNGAVVLHDAGATIRNYVIAGGDPEVVKKGFKNRATRRGFRVDDQIALLSPPIPAEATPVWTGFLGECILEMAEWLAEKHAKDTALNIKGLLDTELEKIFGKALERDAHIQGASGKTHKFHWVIQGRSKRLVVDAVSPEGTAVYAAFSKHMDLALDERDDLINRITYDPEENWHSQDLNFLQRAALLIDYHDAPRELERLVA